jgi:hypothetical protein
MDAQLLLHPFTQAPRRARIEIHQSAMQRIERFLGSRVAFQRLGRIPSLRHGRFLFVRQMIQDIRALVNLAALNRGRFASMLFQRP